MNKFLRQELKNWNFLLWFVFVAIGAQYFMRAPRTAREATVATINGSKITAHELQRGILQETAMRNLLSQYLGQKFQVAVNPDEVLKKMVQQEVVGYHAYQAGARLGDEVVSQHIFNMLPPFVFQRDGTVNATAYGEYVKSQGFTVAEFEKMQERNLLQSFLHNALYTSVVMPDWFLEYQWHKQHDKKKYQIGIVSYSAIKKEIDTAAISDEQLKSYFEAHQEAYRIPEKREIQYAEISFKEYAERSNFSEDEIKGFYDRNKARYFSTAPDASVREIFVSSEGNEQAEKEILDIHSKVKKEPGLFVELAKEHIRKGDSTQKNGIISTVKKGAVDENIRRAALRLKEKGEISSVVKLHNGYSLLQLESKEEPRVRPLHEVRQDVIQRLQGAQSGRQLTTQIRQIVRAAKENPSIAFDAMKDLGAAWKRTTVSMSRPQATSIEDRLSEAAFRKNLQEGSIHFIQTQDAIAVFKIESIQSSQVPVFKEVRATVLDDYLNTDIRRRAKEKATDIQQKLLSGAELKEMDCQMRVTGFMNQAELEDQVSKHPEYSTKMLLLQDKKHVLRHHDDEGYYLVQISDIQENNDMPTASDEKNKAFGLHYEGYKEMWLGIFIAYLEKNATIVYNAKF